MKKERGSITVEAALFLPVFLMAFLTIYNLVYFARAQMLMQYAADQAAKEVAQYSYILEKTGILESLDNLNTKTESFESDMNSIRENLETIQSAGEKAVQGQDEGNQIAGIKSFMDTFFLASWIQEKIPARSSPVTMADQIWESPR